jgi:RNA polymerase sigma factor (TIGR02999 family)
MMRRVLVDHARRRSAAKRGGGSPHLELAFDPTDDDAEGDTGGAPDAGSARHNTEVDVEAVHEALERLEAFDPQQGKLVELRFFGGLSIKDAAEVMGVSPATAKREWAVARAWLQRELTAGEQP